MSVTVLRVVVIIPTRPVGDISMRLMVSLLLLLLILLLLLMMLMVLLLLCGRGL